MMKKTGNFLWAASVAVVILTIAFSGFVVFSSIKSRFQWGDWQDYYETLNAYVTSLEATIPIQSDVNSYFSESAVIKNYCFFIEALSNMRNQVETGSIPDHAAKKVNSLLSRAVDILSNEMSNSEKKRIEKLFQTDGKEQGVESVCEQSLNCLRTVIKKKVDMEK